MAIQENSVPTMAMALTNLVGIECSASGASTGAYQRPFLSADETADTRAC